LAEERGVIAPALYGSLARSVLGGKGEEQPHQANGNHGEAENRVPSECLRQARRKERREQRTRIPRPRDSHRQALILRRIPAASQWEGCGEARARDPQEHTHAEKCRKCSGPLPRHQQWQERERQADHAGTAAADPLRHPAQQDTEERTAEQRHGREKTFLRGAEFQALAEERSQRAENDPDHEADVEV